MWVVIMDRVSDGTPALGDFPVAVTQRQEFNIYMQTPITGRNLPEDKNR
jgi:hypothetical protein